MRLVGVPDSVFAVGILFVIVLALPVPEAISDG